MHFVFYTVNLTFYNIYSQRFTRICDWARPQNIYVFEFIRKSNRIGSLYCIFAETLMKHYKIANDNS